MPRNFESLLQPGAIVTINGTDFVYLGHGMFTPQISGGDGEGTKEPTLAELMKMIQDQNTLIRQQQAQMQEQKSQFDELVDAIANAVESDEGEEEAEEGGEEPPQRTTPNPANQGDVNNTMNSDEVAKLRRELQKQAKQMEEMQRVIQQREQAAEEEREMRLASQRDTLLQGALQAAGVLPNAMEAALKLFRDNVAYDDENDAFWFVEDKTGVKLPIEEGIKDNMPDYLKQSKTPVGGSGGRGSQAAALIEQARNGLKDLHVRAQKSGNESDIAAYHAAKKKLLDLEGKRSGATEGGEGTRPPVVSPGVARTVAAARGRQQLAPSGDDDFGRESA